MSYPFDIIFKLDDGNIIQCIYLDRFVTILWEIDLFPFWLGYLWILEFGWFEIVCIFFWNIHSFDLEVIQFLHLIS